MAATPGLGEPFGIDDTGACCSHLEIGFSRYNALPLRPTCCLYEGIGIHGVGLSHESCLRIHGGWLRPTLAGNGSLFYWTGLGGNTGAYCPKISSLSHSGIMFLNGSAGGSGCSCCC